MEERQKQNSCIYVYIDDDVVIGDKNLPRNTYQLSRKYFHSINIRYPMIDKIIAFYQQKC